MPENYPVSNFLHIHTILDQTNVFALPGLLRKDLINTKAPLNYPLDFPMLKILGGEYKAG